MRALEQTDLSHVTVGDMMQHSVETVPADMPLSEVARLLWDRQVSGAPVVTDDGRPIGIVSASDLVRVRGYGPHYQPPGSSAAAPSAEMSDLALLAPHGEPRRHAPPGREPTARDVMTPATFSVRTTTTLPELAQFLVRAGIHRALVLDAGRLLGIVTAFDIVEELARHAPSGAPAEQGTGDEID